MIEGKATLLLNGQPVDGWQEFKWDPAKRPGRGYMRTVMALHWQMQIAKAEYERWLSHFAMPDPPAFWITWKPKKRRPPKPCPKAYRLKRRYLGSKRRNRR